LRFTAVVGEPLSRYIASVQADREVGSAVRLRLVARRRVFLPDRILYIFQWKNRMTRSVVVRRTALFSRPAV
jgi:hypothetical protein